MNLTLAAIGKRSLSRDDSTTILVDGYVARAAHYFPTEAKLFLSEHALFDSAEKRQGRTPTHLILLDPHGKPLSSEAFAAYLGVQRDRSARHVIMAVGPANGWSDAARARAHLLLSLGPMTFPHELALVMLAEQVYRALTILAGHPYHTGH